MRWASQHERESGKPAGVIRPPRPGGLTPVTLLALALALACGPGPEPPIRVGATMSQTGAYATQGVPARNGYLLCQEELNSRGGVLGRPVEFLMGDDTSDTETAVRLYEEFITVEGVDAVLGPYGSTLTEAVAPVTERHRQIHISPLAATTSIWEQGREYLFMVLPPAELFLAGLVEMAHEGGFTRLAVIHEDALFPKAAAQGAVELARERGMEVVIHEAYPSGTSDFRPLLEQVRGSGAAGGEVEVLAMAASNLGDFARVVQTMKELQLNVAMFGTSGAVAEFQEELGPDAEYAFGLSAWEPVLPHPGAGEFTQAYRGLFGQDPSFHAAGAFGSCLLWAEAVEEAGSLDPDAIRKVLLSLETITPFGPYAVDHRGYQTANRGVFIQWQDGQKAVVWPEDLATASPRIPTPEWDRR